MPKPRLLITAVALAALVPLSPLAAAAEPLRLAMMDMMPVGGGTMPAPAPGGAAMPGMPAAPGAQAAPAAPSGGGMGRMNDDIMRMGGSMPAQGQNQAAQQPPAAMCPMMAMMRDMMRMRGAQGMAPMPGGATDMDAMGSSAARLDGRIAFLRTELRITDAQAGAWDAFAATLRAGREHLDAARTALQDSTRVPDPMARLESFERHLWERTEAIHMTRMAFNTLYAQLDDAQKRMAATTMLPFIGAF